MEIKAGGAGPAHYLALRGQSPWFVKGVLGWVEPPETIHKVGQLKLIPLGWY